MANENKDEKSINQMTDEDWKDFAKNNPRIVEIMTNELKESNSSTNDNQQIDNANQITSIIKRWLASLSDIYTKIKSKFTSENIKLVTEILDDILQSFAFSDNRENSVAIAFILKNLNEVPSLPTMREIPRIGIYITVLTILIESARIIFSLTFDQDKQEIRNKIARLFK